MRQPIDLSVYLVLDPDLCGGAQGMIDTTRAAVQNGATCVQLRAPHWKKRALVECGRALKSVLADFHVPLIINDHADVCLAVDAEGLHVGQDDLSPSDARTIIGNDKILGLSVSNKQELSAVDVRLVDHLGIGPIFSTSTKPDASDALGIDGFASLASCKPCPIVAIGSVKVPIVGDLIQAGADGVAVVSAICGQTNPGLATKEIVRAMLAARLESASKHSHLK